MRAGRFRKAPGVRVSGVGEAYFLEAGLVALMAVPRKSWPGLARQTTPRCRFLSSLARAWCPRPALPLWQKVSRCSSPVSMLATHRSLLLMKEKKVGSAGQILGSIRGPEHWVLISSGFMGDICRQRGLAQGGRMPPTCPTHPQPGTRAYHEAILAPIPTVEEAVTGLEEEEATLAVEVIGGDSKDPQALPLPKELLLPRVDPMVGSGLKIHRTDVSVSSQRPWQPGHSWEGPDYLTWVHTGEDVLTSRAVLSRWSSRAPDQRG